MRRILLVLIVVSGAARAQPIPDALSPANPDAPTQPDPPTPAMALFAEGRALLDGGKPAEACAKFEASLKLDPDAPGTVLNLGLCNEQIDRLATALKWFRRVQVRASETAMATAEAAAKDRAAAAASRVPTVKLGFTHPPPAGLAVTIDGTRIDEIDFARIELDAGRHVVVATGLPAPFSQDFEIADGQAKTFLLPVPAPEKPKQFIMIDRGRDQRRHAYLLGGAGLGLYAVDTVLGLVAKSKYDAAERPDTQQAWKNTMRYGGTAIFLVGSAAIGAAVWLYVTAPAHERVEQTVVTPVASRDTLGLSVSGRF